MASKNCSIPKEAWKGGTVSLYKDDIKMIDVIREVIEEHSSRLDGDEAFFVMNLGYLIDAAIRWKQRLPRVHPFFAFKANGDPVLIHLMKELNLGFDCASLDEIQKVVEMGVHPSKIVYANPHKQVSYLKKAASLGIDLGTFDDESELLKIKQVAPNMRLLLRLSTAGFTKCLQPRMGTKFGCPKHETKCLLETARQLGLNVKGVCFHIGVGAQSPEAYARAIRDAREVFEQGVRLGFKMNILDIGGGFPSITATIFSKLEFNTVASTICESLNKEFPNDDTVQIIAEPGSYFAAPPASLLVNIIGKRKSSRTDEYQRQNSLDTEYFINDGMYSSFRLYWDVPPLLPVVKPVHPKYFGKPVFKSKLWGQTCAEDVAVEECELPDMDVGDWLYVKDTGAYCSGMCSKFNGFQPRPVYRYVCGAMKMKLDAFIQEGGLKYKSVQ